MHLKKSLDRIGGQIYAALVKEDLPRGYRSHVFVMRAMGIWSTADDSPYHQWLTLSIVFFVGALLPLSLFIVAFYTNNIRDAIEHTFLPLNICATIIKTTITYCRCNTLRDIFHIHVKLMNANGANAVHNERVARNNYIVHVCFLSLYLGTMCGVAVHTVITQPEDTLFPSTSLLPYDFAQRRSVFLGGLAYQLLAAYCTIIWVATLDALFFAVINTLCGHLAQLREQLQRLGTTWGGYNDGGDLTFYRDLIDCCQYYEDCAR